jgi:hypothetical protein
MPCDIVPGKPTVWEYTRGGQDILLSDLVASIPISHLRIDRKKLKLYVNSVAIKLERNLTFVLQS